MTLDELLNQLKNLTYIFKYHDGSKHEAAVITQDQFDKVEQLIRQYALDNHDSELGELKAKVYAYEKIIANSNFAPTIKEKEMNKMSKSGWISVKDKLPKYEKDVLCMLSYGEMDVLHRECVWGEDVFVDGGLGTGTFDVVAWMPLPKPYSDEF